MKIQPLVNKYDEASILEIISNNLEESINLEFKSSGALSKNEKHKNEISKDISSFANSAGGVLVYGIEEEDHKASRLSYIDGNTITKEWLEQVIQTRIQRKILNIRIDPIRVEGKIDQSVYVVIIPESHNAPHMAHDNRYYKRFNFESVRMEEYEVRQLYSRQSKTELKIGDILISRKGNSKSQGRLQYQDFGLIFQIRNIGNAIENQYKLEVGVPESAYIKTDEKSNPFRDYLIRKDGNRFIFTIPNKSPLFQEELTTMANCHIRIDRESYREICSTPLTLKLYYSNGYTTSVVDLSKELYIDGKLINLTVFDN